MAQILNQKKVTQITGKSRSTIWRWVRDGNFPVPLSLGKNSIGWLETDIQAWIEAKRLDVRGKSHD